MKSVLLISIPIFRCVHATKPVFTEFLYHDVTQHTQVRCLTWCFVEKYNLEAQTMESIDLKLSP